ncbi:hypothetical protein J4467_01605 [Candidatus Woesearchaeota archaeon]|nr:hypothetical protein [Candidatus Woesearchaeota archaeon]
MEENEEMSAQELAIAAYNKVDALIDLLIKKNIITEAEFEAAEEDLYKELESEEEKEE